MAVAKKDGKLGVIDKEGKEVIEFGKYEYIGFFSEGVAVAKKDGVKIKIDKEGNEVK